MKDGEALRILFKITPVRVRFGDVPANDEFVSIFANDHRDVAGEGAVFVSGHQDDKGIRLHERNGCGMVTDYEMFGYVHGSSSFSVRFLCSTQFTLRAIGRSWLGRDGEAAAVDGGEDGVATAAEEGGAGIVAELFGIVSVAGVAEDFGAVGIGHDGFEMKANPSG